MEKGQEGQRKMTKPSDGPKRNDTNAFLQRTELLLGAEPLRTLQNATVAIPGCGGVGGATAILLARTGIGGFVLADPGTFDPPDINRQWAAATSTLGRNKADVYAELLR